MIDEVESWREMSDVGARILIVRLKNVGKERIVLDRRFLYSGVAGHFRDENGKQVPVLSIEFSRFSPELMVILMPGEEIGIAWNFGGNTYDALVGSEYSVWWESDNRAMKYPQGAQVWRGKIRSNAILLRAKASPKKRPPPTTGPMPAWPIGPMWEWP